MRNLALVAVIVGAWWLWRDEPRRASPARVQAAVLRDGFAVLAGPRLGVYGRDGAARGEATLRLDRAELRLVGTRVGAAVGWLEGGRVVLGQVRADGKVEIDSSWGKRVTRLCDGAASNEHRFGIAWAEPDGRVWVVHGPVVPAALALEAPAVATATAGKAWCGVASADQDVALFWRERNALQFELCSTKKCSGFPVRVPVGARDTVVGFGCADKACVIAARDGAGAVQLHRVSERGRKAVQVLDGAAAGTPVTITGAGPRAVAIAYLATSGRVAVRRVSLDGAVADVTTLDGGQVPSLAWADGRLLVAPPAGAPITVALPR